MGVQAIECTQCHSSHVYTASPQQCSHGSLALAGKLKLDVATAVPAAVLPPNIGAGRVCEWSHGSLALAGRLKMLLPLCLPQRSQRSSMQSRTVNGLCMVHVAGKLKLHMLHIKCRCSKVCDWSMLLVLISCLNQ